MRAKIDLKSTKMHQFVPKWGSRGGQNHKFSKKRPEGDVVWKKTGSRQGVPPLFKEIWCPKGPQRAPKIVKKSIKIKKKSTFAWFALWLCFFIDYWCKWHPKSMKIKTQIRRKKRRGKGSQQSVDVKKTL